MYSFSDLHLNKNSNVLVVFPHPDDEAVFAGGLIQRVLKNDANVKLVCLTKGEASTLRNGVKDTDDLAYIREKEFKEVCRRLNITNFVIGNFKDGGLKLQAQELEIYLTTLFKEFEPQLVITYEPDGVYGHPDHITTSKVIKTVCKKFKDTQLLYATVTTDLEFSEGTKNMAENPQSIKPIEPNLIFTLTTSEFLNKLRVLNLYKSQIHGQKRSKRDLLKKIMYTKKEYFHLVKS